MAVIGGYLAIYLVSSGVSLPLSVAIAVGFLV